MAVDTKRNFSGGKYAFEIDGKTAALVKKIDGLFGKTAVTTVPNSVGVPYKSIGNVEFEDGSCDFSLSMGQPLVEWINASMAGEHMRKSGAVIAADADGNARTRRDFMEALITEVNFPACDASSKDTATFSFKFKPELVQESAATGKVAGEANLKQKLFLPSNFRFELGSLPCAGVNKIDAFSFKQGVVLDPVGDSRIAQITPANITFTELKVQFGARDDKAWKDWFRDFVIDGNCGQDKELNGSLTWLSQNRKEELARVDFKQVGIIELKQGASEAGKDGLIQMNATLYFESCSLIIN